MNMKMSWSRRRREDSVIVEKVYQTASTGDKRMFIICFLNDIIKITRENIKKMQ